MLFRDRFHRFNVSSHFVVMGHIIKFESYWYLVLRLIKFLFPRYTKWIIGYQQFDDGLFVGNHAYLRFTIICRKDGRMVTYARINGKLNWHNPFGSAISNINGEMSYWLNGKEVSPLEIMISNEIR